LEPPDRSSGQLGAYVVGQDGVHPLRFVSPTSDTESQRRARQRTERILENFLTELGIDGGS